MKPNWAEEDCQIKHYWVHLGNFSNRKFNKLPDKKPVCYDISEVEHDWISCCVFQYWISKRSYFSLPLVIYCVIIAYHSFH